MSDVVDVSLSEADFETVSVGERVAWRVFVSDADLLFEMDRVSDSEMDGVDDFENEGEKVGDKDSLSESEVE